MSLAFDQTSRQDAAPNDLEAWWLPFTANRAFKKNPRMITGAKDMYYLTPDGKKIMFSSNRNNGGTHDTNLFVADWVD